MVAVAGYVGLALVGWAAVCLFQCVGAVGDWVCPRLRTLCLRLRRHPGPPALGMVPL